MGAIRCVVFDVDDTLYLERDYVRSGFLALDPLARELAGVESFSALAWAAFERGVRRTIFDEALAAAGKVAEPALVSALVDRYRSHRPRIELLPDARACIAGLAPRAALAAITDGPAASQRAKVDALGLEAWMRPVVLTDELGPGCGKPDPRSYRHVEATLDVRGGACAYVADNPTKDFVAPRALGWRTIRIRRPLSLHQELPSGADVDLELADLSALARALELDP